MPKLGIGLGLRTRRRPSFRVLSLAPGLWIDAAQDEANYGEDDPVPSAADWSGNDRHATQETGGNQPVFKLALQNGQPAYRFDGVDDFMQTASWNLVHPVTTFAVWMQREETGTNRWLFDGTTQLRLGVILQAGSPPAIIPFAGNGMPLGDSDALTFHRLYAVFNGASSSGALDALAAVSGDVGANNNPGGICLGALGGGGSSWAPVDLGELIVVPRVCAPAEIAGAMAYLKAKWGL